MYEVYIKVYSPVPIGLYIPEHFKPPSLAHSQDGTPLVSQVSFGIIVDHSIHRDMDTRSGIIHFDCDLYIGSTYNIRILISDISSTQLSYRLINDHSQTKRS